MFSAINRTIKRMLLRHERAKPIVRISDTTLRDGLQTPGLRVPVESRVKIAQALADAGIHSIDIGFPAANAIDLAAVKAIAAQVHGPVFSVHSRTKIEDVDISGEALAGVSPFRRAISLFIGISPLHREHKHRMSKAEIIKTLVKSVERAQKYFEIISFGPEDASRTEPEFLYECYREAIAAGCVSVGFADTVGVLTPDKAADYIKGIFDRVPNIDDALVGVHFHNDLGLATANSLACIKAGAHTVQGTINGVGERAGNTPLEEVVMALALHKDEFKRTSTVDARALAGLSKVIAELTGFPVLPNKTVVGRNIFRTEAGVHQDGVLKNQMTYLPFPPEAIGAGPVELVLGANSGRAAVRHVMQKAGIEVTDELVELFLNYVKSEDIAGDDMAEVESFMSKMRPYLAENEQLAQAAAGMLNGDGLPHPRAVGAH
jgi:2-isopropylmalate synthase